MEKYKIKKAGIGMKTFPSNLSGRVFESKTFGLAYIVSVKGFKDEYLGYPALILAPISAGNSIHPFICYVSEDEETWDGEITTKDGKKVSSIDTIFYF